jgi:hypothetical protein
MGVSTEPHTEGFVGSLTLLRPHLKQGQVKFPVIKQVDTIVVIISHRSPRCADAPQQNVGKVKDERIYSRQGAMCPRQTAAARRPPRRYLTIG